MRARPVFCRCALLAIWILAGFAPRVSAQTIRPILSEFRTKANGRFELVNPTPYPLDVVIEPRSFVVDEDGELKDLPLDPAIHVELSAMSLRIPPQQSRFVFYKATADRLPAWFVLYANLRGPVRPELKGLDLQIELPHVAYLLPKEKLRNDDVHVRIATERSRDGIVVLDIQNSSGTFGRIYSMELKGPGRVVVGPSVPVFPGRHRFVEIAWDHSKPPQRVVLKTRDFKVELPLAESIVATDGANQSPR
jgi:hypothetical protein